MFNTSSKCFVRQAHGIYKSSETPAGLPDYRVRLDPYGTEEISIKFNPTPAVEHVVLWCNSTQKAVCSSTDCQRAYLSAGYGMTVFRNVKSCEWYTLKICPQVSLSSRILYVAEVFIPVENINDDLIINQQQGVTASAGTGSSSETMLPWIVVGGVVGVVLLGLVFTTILVFKYRERCHFTREEIKYSKQHKTSTISNISSDCPSEILALFANDATPIPIFYYPDNKEHIDTVNWWAKRIQKNAGGVFNIQTYSVMDPIFNQVMSNVFDKFGLFNMIFIVYSPQVFKMTPQRKLFKNTSPINSLPRRKLQLNISPIKQIILQKIHRGRNNVCILDVCEEKSDDEVIEMNCLLDFNKVIQLEEGQVQDSVQRVIQELKIHQNQTSPNKLTKDDSSEFHDGGYYSGPKCFQSDETNLNRSVMSFFPPSEIDDALSETSIMERLEEINERSCAYGDHCRMDSIQIISNGKSMDTLSI
ncbi:uncharacterized protein LOC126827458 [Patella vulgata]|uniref:uncharacterized protein LOC126827458 n=1 Tax=Patella vulgata TaxID=6465 RepID=UPI0024A8345F|nr:uncharacterized protein LOC126827458 [Patella vulgata]